VDSSEAEKKFRACSVTFQLILRKYDQTESANPREEEIYGCIYRHWETMPKVRRKLARALIAEPGAPHEEQRVKNLNAFL
jgi:hypothetical protein